MVVETKQSVGSSANVTLTRQTCGQSSSRAAGSKRRARARGGKGASFFGENNCRVHKNDLLSA